MTKRKKHVEPPVLQLDTAGFLEHLDLLERRFNQTVTARLSVAGQLTATVTDIDPEDVNRVQEAQGTVQNKMHNAVAAREAQLVGIGVTGPARLTMRNQLSNAAPDICDDRFDFSECFVVDVNDLTEEAVVGGNPLDFGECFDEPRGSSNIHSFRNGEVNEHANVPLEPHELVRMAVRLFGFTSWATTIGTAATSGNAVLVSRVRKFFRDATDLVHARGLAAWLVSVIQDALVSRETDRPSVHMPIMRVMSEYQAVRQLSGTARKRFGTKKQRMADMEAYVNESFRMAATVVLTWSENASARGIQSRNAQYDNDLYAVKIAMMLLSHGGVGLSMLRNAEERGHWHSQVADDSVAIASYLDQLQVKFDMEYAMWMVEESLDESSNGSSNGSFSDEDDPVTILSRRYIYDVNALVSAYRKLWERHVMSAGLVLDKVHYNRPVPRVELWSNPVALQLLGDAMIGPWASGTLRGAFERRDSEQFEAAVTVLEEYRNVVHELGIGFLPAAVLRTLHDRFMTSIGGGSELGASPSASFALFGGVQESGSFGKSGKQWTNGKQQFTKGKCTKYLRDCGNVCDDMAYMLLSRISDVNCARRMALAVLHASVDDPSEVLMELCVKREMVREALDVVD